VKLSRWTAEEGQPKRKIIKSREDLMTRRWTKHVGPAKAAARLSCDTRR
jgi:hypothetical protein